MRRFAASLILASLAWFAPAVHAESHNPADYPLRIHIYRRNQTTFYNFRQAAEANGEGRGNLFEGGEPKGVDFQFDCSAKLRTSSGYETYPAKWKKPGKELLILQQQFGKTSYDTCNLKVLIKDFVYISRNGNLTTEPVEVFKQWMTRHDYDPEHGKETPVRTTAEGAAGAAGAPGDVPSNPPGGEPPAPGNPPQ